MATPLEPSNDTQDLPLDSGEKEHGLDFLAPSAKSDSLGRLGHYEVLDVLGRGGFGIVLKAFDDVLHRVVAIKVLAPEMAATSPARKRFLREARSAASLRHENVVQIYAVEETPLPYLVMEFIPGETLQEHLDRNGPIDVSEVLRVGAQIARGLAAAHDLNLVHRDIKPANILIEDGLEKRVKLTDFGLARSADDASMTQSGIVSGTPMYMAPEQARGEHVDQRADLFSLGSVLYVMVSGRPPFRAANTLAVLKRVNEDAPRPIREIIPETPQWLCDVIAKLHAKDPAKRIPSAHAVAGILADRLTQSQLERRAAASTDAPTSPAATPVPTGARPVLGRWLALLVAAALIGVGGYALYERNFNQPKDVGNVPPKTFTVMEKNSPKLLPQPLATLLTSADYEWSPLENLGPAVNTDGRDLSPTLTADECTLIYSRGSTLWHSRRNSVAAPFAAAEPLPAIIAEGSDNPTITADGLLLAFSSNRDGNDDIWLSSRKSRDEPFGDPVRLPEPVNGPSWERAPLLSADGLTLFVTAARAGGPGGGEIVQFKRKTRDDDFASEMLLPAPINSPAFDVADWLSKDNRVLLSTKMALPPFELRLHVRPAADAPFGPTQHLGPPFDARNCGRPWLSPDGQRLYFHSREFPDGHGELDLWMTHRVPKQRTTR